MPGVSFDFLKCVDCGLIVDTSESFDGSSPADSYYAIENIDYRPFTCLQCWWRRRDMKNHRGQQPQPQQQNQQQSQQQSQQQQSQQNQGQNQGKN